jgi:hypothetical protein
VQQTTDLTKEAKQAASENESMAAIPAFRHAYHQGPRNYNPVTSSTVRARAPSWIKRAVLCLVLALLCVMLNAWVEQPSANTPNRLLTIENFSSEESPQRDDDDAFQDAFYFSGGRLIWFDVTLEGRWTLFKQRLLGLMAWLRSRNPDIALIRHDNAGSMETLMELETQSLIFVRRRKEEDIHTLP